LSRKKLAVIFGGRSGEHIVSLRSAASIIKAVDQVLYEVIQVGITAEGAWITGPDAWLSLWEKRQPRESFAAALLTNPSRPGLLIQKGDSPQEWHYQELDLAFPVLHGTYGEDGTIQGLFEMAGLPYVGSGVLASSAGMDKVVMKVLFREAGLPVASYHWFYRWQWAEKQDEIAARVNLELGFPCFVKPANLGSSVGISKVHAPVDLPAAVDEAFLYDEKVIIEAFVDGREIECSVLGDINPEASLPGEVVPCNEFYDYRAKYLDDRSELIIPARLGTKNVDKIRDYSLRAFTAVEANGLARVDFFLDRSSGEIILNEINTMPGFTDISMFSKMWEASGISYAELVGKLLHYAENRHKRRLSLLASPPE
jgi:D-alanine-D-alanine ligase